MIEEFSCDPRGSAVDLRQECSPALIASFERRSFLTSILRSMGCTAVFHVARQLGNAGLDASDSRFDRCSVISKGPLCFRNFKTLTLFSACVVVAIAGSGGAASGGVVLGANCGPLRSVLSDLGPSILYSWAGALAQLLFGCLWRSRRCLTDRMTGDRGRGGIVLVVVGRKRRLIGQGPLIEAGELGLCLGSTAIRASLPTRSRDIRVLSWRGHHLARRECRWVGWVNRGARG